MPHNRNNGRFVATGVRQMPGMMVQHQHGLDPLAHQPGYGGQRPRESLCCVPTGCPRYQAEPINEDEPGDSVKVFCNNEHCSEGKWMHLTCFQTWEESVLAYLRTCGRARSWSEKQRLQNLWTKKGYDLAFKACDCKCGRGHLRKDLVYVPKAASQEGGDKKRRRHKSKPHSASPPLERGNHMMMGIQAMKAQQQQLLQQMAAQMQQQRNNHPQLRIRTSSFGSTGSMSPPSSAGTPPLTPNGSTSSGDSIISGSSSSSAPNKKACKFDFFSTQEQAAAGNIFRRRTDYSVFNFLPRHQQNPYHIKMEDEGPHGNDETRCFVLTNLSTHQVTEVSCVVCSQTLPIYDKYPLIDGTFFLSPQRYNTDLQVLSDSKMLYLNAVCMKCQEAPAIQNQLRCLACRQPWYGSAFMIGSMYSYDVFAALPCCGHRLRCKNCSRAIMDPSCGFNFFSEYSKPIRCPHCQAEDYHFIKPLDEVFSYKGPIRK